MDTYSVFVTVGQLIYDGYRPRQLLMAPGSINDFIVVSGVFTSGSYLVFPNTVCGDMLVIGCRRIRRIVSLQLIAGKRKNSHKHTKNNKIYFFEFHILPPKKFLVVGRSAE
jgi:hypothetical protein